MGRLAAARATPAGRAPRSRRPAAHEWPACRICEGPVSPRYSLCTSCRDVAVSLGRPLVPVTSIAVVTASSSLYRALREYKCATHVVARRQTARLAALLRRFARGRVGDALGEADATVVVPSGPSGRPPPHPLSAVASAAALGPVAPWLRTRRDPSTPIVHRRASRDAFVASREVAGRRLLLLDDVYTTGAHLQSAAAALEEAGAAEVRSLVIARFARWPLGDADRDPCLAPAHGRAPRSRAPEPHDETAREAAPIA